MSEPVFIDDPHNDRPYTAEQRALALEWFEGAMAKGLVAHSTSKTPFSHRFSHEDLFGIAPDPSWQTVRNNATVLPDPPQGFRPCTVTVRVGSTPPTRHRTEEEIERATFDIWARLREKEDAALFGAAAQAHDTFGCAPSPALNGDRHSSEVIEADLTALLKRLPK